MRGRSLSALVAAVLALTACEKSPPDYVSRYTEPSTPGSAAAAAPPTMASFFDNFDRPDTQLGLAAGWDLRGPYKGSFPLPPATDGFIRNGSYTYAGKDVVYAVRKFRAPVERMGTVGEFTKTGDGAETGLAMAITPNDKLVFDMVHFAANRSTWALTIRRNGGDFVPVASGAFTPTLDFDRDYVFEIAATDKTITVRVPGQQQTYPADTSGLIGDLAFWEEYPTKLPAGVAFDFDSVWAAEAGQPMSPISR